MTRFISDFMSLFSSILPNPHRLPPSLPKRVRLPLCPIIHGKFIGTSRIAAHQDRPHVFRPSFPPTRLRNHRLLSKSGGSGYQNSHPSLPPPHYSLTALQPALSVFKCATKPERKLISQLHCAQASVRCNLRHVRRILCCN